MANLENTKIKAVPKPKEEIGIDTEGNFIDSIIEAAAVGAVDISSIDSLNRSAQSRETMYELIDAMSKDDIISAVIETYAEDTVQTNDKGQIVWIEANDSKVLNFTSWLLDLLNIDKHIYQWAHCLITYGDVYLRLYRQSDQGNDYLFKNNTRNKQLNEAQAMLHNNKLSEEVQADLKQLNEDVVLKVYSQNDPYIHYVEMVQDPGEMFDLQKFGKTHGYIKASTRKLQYSKDDMFQYLNRYKVEQKDVEIYDAMSFVHGCIEGTTQRQLDTIDIFLDQNTDDDSNEDSMTTSYSVKRGQSLLYNSFRIWRELNLLEMSALLNRLTKSSLIRIMNVEVGDMPKEQVRVYIQRLKEKMEQKTGVDVNNALTSYNNPGPIENTIYVPTHNGQGAINPTNIGGDFDPKALTDIEYFRDKLFGSLKVPKQFFGFTADGAGFNGGASLSIISSRYGKTIKKLQNILCQMITDVINLFLIDRGMHNYVNQFTVRMQTPVTQEEQDRRTNTDNRIRYVGDLMNQLNIIEDNVTKLKIYKILLTNCINDSDVITIIQEHIEALEAKLASEKENSSTDTNNTNTDFSTSGENDDQLPEVPISLENTENDETSENISLENFYNDSDKDLLLESEEDDDSYLPSPDDLGIDLTKDIE